MKRAIKLTLFLKPKAYDIRIKINPVKQIIPVVEKEAQPKQSSTTTDKKKIEHDIDICPWEGFMR